MERSQINLLTGLGLVPFCVSSVMSSPCGETGDIHSVELELCLAESVTDSTEAQLEPVSNKENVTNSC